MESELSLGQLSYVSPPSTPQSGGPPCRKEPDVRGTSEHDGRTRVEAQGRLPRSNLSSEDKGLLKTDLR